MKKLTTTLSLIALALMPARALAKYDSIFVMKKYILATTYLTLAIAVFGLVAIGISPGSRADTIPAGCPGSKSAGPPVPGTCPPVDVFTPGSIPAAVANGPTVSELIVNVVSILSFVAGAASVIAIIVGGIMYSVSGGNESRTKTAKDAILYAVIGLVISLSAFAIANFVITGLG